jgi:hypothetical protein
MYILLHATQIGGFITTFEFAGNSALQFNFITVRGSGHMVPAYAPQRATHLLKHGFLAKQPSRPLSPPLPYGWDSESDLAFYGQRSAGGSSAVKSEDTREDTYAASSGSSGSGGSSQAGFGTFAQWVQLAMSGNYSGSAER